MPRASIILPAYNAEVFVNRAIDSVLTQTESDLELIVVDDASTDATTRIVARRAAQDARIRLIQLKSNSGASRARNIGLAAARGDWIALLDADDWFAPSRVKDLTTLGELYDANIIADNQYWISERTLRPWRLLFRAVHTAPHWVLFQEFLRRDMPGTWTCLGYLQPVIRRSFLQNSKLTFDEKTRVGADFDFLARCVFLSQGLLLSSTPSYYYFTRSNSLSNSAVIHDFLGRKMLNDRLIKQLCRPNDMNLKRILTKRSRLLGLQVEYTRSRRAILDGDVRGAFVILFRNPFTIYFALKIISLKLVKITKAALHV